MITTFKIIFFGHKKIFCTDCNTDLHLFHIPTRSFFTKILPFGGGTGLYVLHRRLLCRWNEYWREIFSQSLCSQNTDGGKRSLKRWGQGRKIVLAGKTNDRRLYPAGAKETSPSFHMTDCSNIHSHGFLRFLTKIQARHRKTLQQKVLNQVCGYHIIIIMNVVGLGLYVQLYLTQSLSDNPVFSIFFLGDIVLFSVSGFFPLCLHVEANIVSSFWSHLLYCPHLVSS